MGQGTQKAWCGRKLGISHLRVFRSIAHVHIPYERRANLDDKGETFIFIDYDNNSKGYKLYNPNNGKIMISQDVVFYKEGECDFSSNAEYFNLCPFKKDEYTSKEQVGAL